MEACHKQVLLAGPAGDTLPLLLYHAVTWTPGNACLTQNKGHSTGETVEPGVQYCKPKSRVAWMGGWGGGEGGLCFGSVEPGQKADWQAQGVNE